MLGRVTRPDGKTITFKYDALWRRIEKSFNGRVHRYLWDGDVVLHEWEYDETERPQPIVAENGDVSFDRLEPTDNLVTWVYDTDSYVPTAKLVNGKRYGIVSDYIGRPVQAYDEHGTLVWQADYDIYGNLLNLRGDRKLVPFRQLGQYEDEETGLYYNRFRYYDPNTGGYISQDPIGLEGDNPTLYGYVFDPSIQIDPLGLDLIEVNPNNINYSQRTVSEIRVFDVNKYEPIRVMDVDGQLVSYDNRRLLSAQNAGLDKLKVDLVNGNRYYAWV